MAYINMKRKDLDDVNDDFSDFSLSSPARKIRRLDMELPPIMEEEEPEIRPVVDQPSVAVVDGTEEGQPMVGPELNENPERALVVFKHFNTHPILQHSPSNFSVSVDSDLISGFKNQFLWPSRPSNMKSAEEEEAAAAANNSMAVIPWVPSQFPFGQGEKSSQEEAPELMDAEEVGESAMEIEGNTTETLQEGHESGLDGTRVNEGLPQWRQQHCLVPHLPYNTSSPISWSY